ncbi:Sigma-70 family RNA polymerase sigma factor [Sulfidibacter corallicola]|uniref:Sigma-70 family RNA polymerase sigma factor n=1 Tax=Sulfidibacter corallicola TaxID=2818388 RepID=A0A8A4TP50_SULCO|nr:ECF-type sigma factor [Sulfidibacter corallicola]QTD51323.1 sigma-70 family RNA polymerase sigma factor [Sulfidibacter corallicola]
MTESEPITRLLNDWQNGDADALTTLITTVYNELRQMAHGAMRWEREGHLYTPTVLVHEAFLKLREQGWDTAFRDRHHFFRILARVMRHILVDHARRQSRQKRGGKLERAELDEMHIGQLQPRFVTLLDDALEVLRSRDPVKSDIVEMRFFGGLSLEQTAEALGLNTSAVYRDWTEAKEILRKEIVS